jgi:16S rRNA (cytosine967-C5)-methyltransferase
VTRGKRTAAATARTRAVEALRGVLESSRNAAPLVGELARDLSPADQDLLRELVLGVLRWKTALDAEIAGTCRIPMQKLIPGLREIMEVALYQVRHLDRIPQYAAVNAAVDQARAAGGEGAAKLVNGVLRNILLLPAPTAHAKTLSLPASGGEGRGEGVVATALARHYSHPTFLVERWLARFGPEITRRILAADNAPSRLDLLTNPRRTNRDALRAALTAEGVETEPSPLAPLALTVLRGNPLRSPLLSAGHFSVQDVGSQLLPMLMPEGDLLVDLAAAPGGKSLSAIAHGRARWTAALDRSRRRLERVTENVRRLGVPEVRPIAADFGAMPLPEGRFERVLLDAPCSGTGTLRKNPEIRYRVTAEAIDRLAGAQAGALSAAARLLAPGGYLLYSTCSLEEEENERVVARVLAGEPDLAAVPIEAPPALAPFVDGARFRLFPDDRCDGFTAHLLRRRPGATPEGQAP